MRSPQNVKSAEEEVAQILHPSTHSPIYEKVKSVRFVARLQWSPSDTPVLVTQTVYAGDEVFGVKNRHDAIEYSSRGNQVK